MTKTTKLLLFGGLGLTVLIVALAIGAYFIFRGSDEAEKEDDTTSQTEEQSDTSDQASGEAEDGSSTDNQATDEAEEQPSTTAPAEQENNQPDPIEIPESNPPSHTEHYDSGAVKEENWLLDPVKSERTTNRRG